MMTEPETFSPEIPVDRRWLWGVRIAALVSILFTLVPLLLLVPIFGPFKNLPLVVVLLAPQLPYGIAVWRLRKNPPERGGLTLALGTGSVVFFVLLALALSSSLGPGHAFGYWLLLFLATQAVLVLCALRALRLRQKASHEPRLERSRLAVASLVWGVLGLSAPIMALQVTVFPAPPGWPQVTVLADWVREVIDPCGSAAAGLVEMLNFGGAFCALLAVVLGHRANRRIRRHAGRKKGSAMAVAASGLGYSVLICGFLVIWSTRINEPWSSGNEASAINSVRHIVTSQITYSATTGVGSYATSLTELGNANLIDSVLASETKNGYTFVTTSGSPDTFTVVVRPLEHGRTGCRCLYSDETGVIRYTREDRPATADDPPIGQ